MNAPQRRLLASALGVSLLLLPLAASSLERGKTPSTLDASERLEVAPVRTERALDTPVARNDDGPVTRNIGDEKDQASKEKAKTAIDFGMLVLTALLVLVGAGQILMFYKQLRAMNQTVEDTKTIAQSAKDSAAAALKTIEAAATAERAYVTMTHRPPGIQMATTGPNQNSLAVLLINMLVTNFGRTPAKITNVVLKLQLLPTTEPLPSVPNYDLDEPRTVQNAFLVAGDAVSIAKEFRKTARDLSEVKNGTMTLHLYGYVDYIDQFGRRHRSGYARKYRPSSDERINFDTDEQFRERSNLQFEPRVGYNYDRVRVSGEGDDWNEGPAADA